MEDTKIIELYWRRDPQAIDCSKEKYGKRLYRIAMGILRSHEDSEECENDTYFSAWHSIPPVRPQSLFAYLSKVCRNGALGMLDRKRAQKRQAELMELNLELQSCIPDRKQDDPADLVALTTSLNTFLEHLDSKDRKIFLRRYWFGDDLKEIAKDLNLRPNTASVRLGRIRMQLREFLMKEGYVYE